MGSFSKPYNTLQECHTEIKRLSEGITNLGKKADKTWFIDPTGLDLSNESKRLAEQSEKLKDRVKSTRCLYCPPMLRW